MKGIKKGLAILLVLCTLLSLVFVAGAAPMPQSTDADQVQATAANDGYKIVHLDCGRKYFTKDWIIALVNEMAADGYNQLELAFGNDGLRFLLNDMSFTANGNNYTHDAVVSAVEAGNMAQNDSGDGRWLTQAEMDGIIAAATAKGIEIVPLLNLPGHANAILDIFNDEYNASFKDEYNASVSNNTFDVTNENGLNAAMAIFQKYVDYFAVKGCKFFNFGADEYANDTTSSFGSMSSSNYTNFVEFVNRMASYIKYKGMTPRAFNDGMYYQGKTSSAALNTSIQCCYWSNGWNGYNVAPASTIANNGHAMINTHGDYYYILGKDDAFTPGKTTTHDESLYTAAARFNNTTFMGGTISNPAGSMFCIWCDFPNAETEQTIAANTRMTLRAMSARMDGQSIDNLSTAVVPGGFNATGTINDGTSTPDPGYTKTDEVTVSVGETVTITIKGENLAGTYSTDNPSIATVEVTGQDAVEATTIHTKVTSNPSWESLIGSDGGPTATNYWYESGGAYYQLYVSRSTGSGISPTRTYTLGFYPNGSTQLEKVEEKAVDGQLWGAWYDDAGSVSATMYTQSTTDEVKASTTITFTGVAAGTTSVIIGDTKYNITVTPEDLNAVAPLTVEYWITNSRLTDSAGNNSTTVAAADAYSENGIAVTEIAPTNTTKENRTLQYWRCRLLDQTLTNSSTNGTEKQTEDNGDDETFGGVEFTKVRYWGGNWAVYTENNTWVSIESKHQLVAYYLEILPVADELLVNAADWGKKGDGSASGDYLDPSSSCTISIQVVYEDGTTNPITTTAADLSSSTIAYGYWTRGRGVGTLNLTGLEGYQIWKVEAETGSESYESSSSIWGSYKVSNFTWDNNPMTVYEGDPVDSYQIHNDANKPSKDGYYQNLMWDENHEAILIKVYVKAKPTEETLKVVYYDEKFNDELYSYYINVNEGVTFADITPEPPQFAGNSERINVTKCGIENTLGVTQQFQTDLTQVPEAVGKYNSKLYTYTGSLIFDDNKTLYLYYTINTEALSPMFVVDFGLPLKFDLSQVVSNVDTVKNVEVLSGRYGDLSYDSTTKQFTYTPTATLQGIDVLTIKITFDGTTVASTTNVGVVPATTVYYEEGFATYSGAVQGGTDKGNGTQTASVAGSKAYYGYDAAYLNNTQDSNGTVATLNAGGEGTFTFTGTGVDVYACTKEDSGKVMIYVYRGSGDNMTLKRLIAVDTRQLGEQSAEDTAYNVPIVSLSGLDYGEYTLVMKEVQTKTDTGKVNYPVYIDGFRVHGTLDVVNTQVYKDDNEANPTFVELRDSVLQVNLNLSEYNGQYAGQIAENVMSQVYAKDNDVKALVINASQTGVDSTNVQDLLENGPKNEIYLKQNESLVFTANATSAQIGLKALNGATTYTINNDTRVSLNTSTDMFYPVNTGMVTITNTGSGILSITELKLFGAGTSTASVEPMSAPALTRALMSLGFEPEPVEATATLNITVQCGDKAVPVTLTADGMSGDTHTFTAAEIKAAVEQALPEGYNVDDVTFSDVTVACGESADVSFTAAQPQTPDTPTSTIGKIIAVAKRVINRIIGWFR